MSAGPYREEPSGLRFVCLVCYRHGSIAASLCPRCEVDLLPLESAEVRAELHAEAERRMQKRMYSEYFGVSLGGFFVALPFLALGGELLYVGAGLGIGWLATKAYARLRPSSALALYAERRRRLELKPSPRGPLVLPAPTNQAAGEDPEDLDLPATLRWLGVGSEDPKRS